MKQASMDESILSGFFLPTSVHVTLYFYVSSTVQQKYQNTDFLYVYLYV